MGEISYNPARLNRYLLGDLSSSERDSIEEEYFADDNLFVELLDAKDRLISDYLRGRLSPNDRAHFENRLLASPECREEVELASFLQQTAFQRTDRCQPVSGIPTQQAERRSWWRDFLNALRAKPILAGATMTALLALAAVCTWVAIQSQPGSTQPEIAGASVFTLELSSGQQRDGQNRLPRIPLASGFQTIALKLDAGTAAYPGYRAKLLRLADGATPAFTSQTLKTEKTPSGGIVVRWEVPAARFQSGEYQVKLEGAHDNGSTENIGSYYFSAAR